MKRLRTIVLGIAFGVFIAFVAAATIEATIRAAYMTKYYRQLRHDVDTDPVSKHPYLAYVMKPNFTQVRTDYPGNGGGTWEYVTNSMGFRSPEFSLRKPAGTYRIVVVGASAVVTGSNTAHTFPGLLARLLNDHAPPGRRYEVIDAGVPGYLSAQELFLIETEVIYWTPDMVIIYDGFNDMGEGSYSPWRANWHPQAKEIWDQVLQSEWDPHTQIMAYRFYLDHIRHEPRFAPPQRHVRPNPQAAVVYRQNLESMIGALKIRGIIPILVYQPTLLHRVGRTPRETQISKGQAQAFLKAMHYMLPLGARAMAAAAKTTHTQWEDFTNIFDGRPETIYMDLVHPTDRSNALIAARLRDLITSSWGAQTQP